MASENKEPFISRGGDYMELNYSLQGNQGRYLLFLFLKQKRKGQTTQMIGQVLEAFKFISHPKMQAFSNAD